MTSQFGKLSNGYEYKNLNILETEHKFLIKLCLRWLMSRIYRFAAEVTFID